MCYSAALSVAHFASFVKNKRTGCVVLFLYINTAANLSQCYCFELINNTGTVDN